MDKRIVICIAIILFLVGLAYYLYNTYEIVQKKREIPPSREYFNNSYLALERWIKETGYPVQINNSLSLDDFPVKEKTIVVLGPNFYGLEHDTEDVLTEWIKSGYNLILCLDSADYKYNFDSGTSYNRLVEYISGLGITVGTTPSYHTYTDENTPDFHWIYKFDIEDGKDYYTAKDIHGNIRLVRIEMDKGSLTILGQARFMQNSLIKKEKNARFTWDIIGEHLDETGVIFIRWYREPRIQKPLFGTLMQRGNIIPVLVSVILLIIFGFWMVIPLFGKVLEEKQKNSQPIKERFAAETSFLKKYKGLYYYDDVIKKIKEEDNGTDNRKT